MNYKKIMLFVTARLPYPPTSGRKNVMYNYCRIMHDIYHLKIVIVSFLERGDAVSPKPDFIEKVYVLPNVTARKKLTNLLTKTLIAGKFPLQVSLFWDDSIMAEIERILTAEQPDYTMADMVRTTEYLRDYSGYKIADLDDLLSLRYQRQLEIDLKYVNPYGAYLYSLPRFIQQLLELKFLKRQIMKKEVKLLSNYEKEICEIYDKTVFVAEQEARKLNQQLGKKNAMSIPLGVDVDYYGAYYRKLEVVPHSICFLGAMSVSHNEAGVIHFIEDILPLVLKRVPDAKFCIVGGGITEQVKTRASEHVILTGRVKDVRDYICRHQVFVCPLIFGSGIKTKNLEAMAMGVPVVTTTIGAENIDAKNDNEWLVADTDEAFADCVVRVMEDQELAHKLQKNAYQFVCNYFTWDNATKKFEELLG